MKKVMFACLVFVLILVTSISAFAAYLGDINDDGSVNAADARIILRHSAKLESIAEELLTRADVDSNGNVNAADARLVLRMSAKLDELKEEHTHNYTSSIKKEATCGEDGIIEYECSGCGDTKEEVIEKTEEHHYISTVIKNDTCGEKGLTEYKCSVCEHTFTMETAITKEHSYTATITKDPSADESGERTYTCSVCGYAYKEELKFFELKIPYNLYLSDNISAVVVGDKDIAHYSVETQEKFFSKHCVIGIDYTYDYDKNILQLDMSAETYRYTVNFSIYDSFGNIVAKEIVDIGGIFPNFEFKYNKKFTYNNIENGKYTVVFDKILSEEKLKEIGYL